MRIATYNVWKSDIGMPARVKHIIESISNANADIIGFQEMTSCVWTSIIHEMNPPFYCFYEYENDDEGLAFISKYPIENTYFLNMQRENKSDALFILVKANAQRIGIANFHLTWDSALKREHEIVNLEKYMCDQYALNDYQIILGDMNCNEQSNVYHFLHGDQSLLNEVCVPSWIDLGTVKCTDHDGLTGKYTVDYQNNPRWKKEKVFLSPVTYDRIFLRCKYSPTISKKFIFGEKVYNETGYSASDHYGVCVDFDMSNENKL